MEEYYDLVKELEMGTRRKKKTEEIIIENKLEKRWWNILAEGLRMEELKRRHQAFVHLSVSLCSKDSHWLRKDGGGSSSDLSRREHCDDVMSLKLL